MEKVLIVIPARYGSSRLPGKPLVKIKGIEMIKRVSDIADFVCRKNESCSYLVATDDERIVLFCESREIPVMMTSIVKVVRNVAMRRQGNRTPIPD